MKYRRRKIISIVLIVVCILLTVFFLYKTLELKKNSIGVKARKVFALPSTYNTINTKVGSATLNTTAQDLSGAVNELNTFRWKSGGNFNGSSYTTLTFPKAGMYLLLTGHNSTPGCNTLWIVQVATTLTTPRYTLIAKGDTSKISITDGTVYNQLNGKTTDGATVNVWYSYLGAYS